MELSEILDIKSKTAAIGLVTKDTPVPVCVMGSGFIVGSEGYTVTAGHVFTELAELQKEIKKDGTETAKAAIIHRFEGNKMIGDYIPFSDTYNLQGHLDTNPNDQIDFDIGVGRPIKNLENCPYFEFEPSRKLNVLEKIIVCGYPGAKQSFSIDVKSIQTQLSPLIQPGLISALTPTDTSENSLGMFLDVIGTAGSSGSPIISEKTGKIIGVVQEVISGPTFDLDQKETLGRTSTGLIFGNSNHILEQYVPKFLEQLRSGKKDLEDIKGSVPHWN